MLGTTLYSAHLGEVALSKTAYEPAMIMGAHAHEFAYVSLVVEGHYAEHSASAPRHLRRGMLVFHPAGEIHADCVLDQSMATVNVEYLTGELPREFICAYGAAVDELADRLLSALPAFGRPLERSLEAVRELLWSEAPRAPECTDRRRSRSIRKRAVRSAGRFARGKARHAPRASPSCVQARVR